MRLKSLTAPILAALMTVSTAATAQSLDAYFKAFSGDWSIFDKSFGTGGKPCQMALKSRTEEGARPSASARNCVAPLSGLAKWDIDGGSLMFFNGEDAPIGKLGGNQLRITGALSDGRGVIAERQSGDGTGIKLTAALRKHRCYFAGLTATCVDKGDLGEPAMTEEGGVFGRVEMLARVNVRSQPRADASVIGVLDKGTCLKINDCTYGSDGVWCRARFGERSGWVAKTALRKGEWPVVTFLNSCTEE